MGCVDVMAAAQALVPSASWQPPPPQSLGHAYASWFAGAGGQPLPDPVLQAGRDGDAAWLHQRVRQIHASGMSCAAARPQRQGKQR